MTIQYQIQLLDQPGRPDMLDINTNFKETPDTCHTSNYYFQDYASLEEAEYAIRETLMLYPYLELAIFKVYS